MNLLKNYINHSKNIVTQSAKSFAEFKNLATNPSTEKIYDLKREQVEIMYDMLTPVQKLYVRKPECDWEAKLLSKLPKEIESEVFHDLDISFKDDGHPKLWEDRELSKKVSMYLLDEEDRAQIDKYYKLEHRVKLYLSAFRTGFMWACNNYEFMPNHAPLLKIDEAIKRIENKFDEAITLAGGGGSSDISLKEIGLPGEELEYQKKACVEGFIFAYESVVYCHYTNQRFADFSIV